MKHIKISVLFMLIINASTFAQVGIGTTTPNTAAVLDITSTTAGVLVPRMTAAQKLLIPLPVAGLLIYQTNGASGFYYFDGSDWQSISNVSGAFATAAKVTSNSPGDYLRDDFVFGSPQLADDSNVDHDRRMFFDKSKGAFRAGYVTDSQWDDASVGLYSIGMGINTTASGLYATALGWSTMASGHISTAIGRNTTAPSYAETSIGLFNTDYTPNNTNAFDVSDRLFTIGNGVGIGSKSNALTIFKNGNATLAGVLTQSSDKRLKTDVVMLSGALSKVLQLNGYNYNWINTEQRGTEKQIGVMAQEIQALYPELVREDSNGYLSVNYSGFVPVLIEATKEQQVQIEKLKQENTKLKTLLSEVEQLKADMEKMKALLQKK